MLLVAEKLCKDFEGLRAVNNMDLQVEAGETVAIVGPNGSGKTTFLDLISGCKPVTSGRIFLNSHEITNLKAYDRSVRGIARISQNIRLSADLTAEDNIIIGRACRISSNMPDGLLYRQRLYQEQRLNASKVHELLAVVGLSACRDRTVKSLAYGAQRRLEIARALACDPQILLLDEPAVGMNPQELDELMRVLDELKKRGLTVLMIAQQMRLVMGIASRVVVFQQGEKIADILPQEMCFLSKITKNSLEKQAEFNK